MLILHHQQRCMARMKTQHGSKECPTSWINIGSVSDAGRGLQGTHVVTPPLTRKHIIQQLLAGDLADLADEGLDQLLPSVSQRLRAGKRSRQSATLSKPKQQPLNSSLGKKSQTNVGNSGLAKTPVCYTSLEQRVLHRLQQSHAENQLVESLRDEVYPELNLKSYLDCKSDLALPTIRQILRGRPADEASELDHYLTKAFMQQKKTYTTLRKGGTTATHGGSSTADSRKRLGQSYPHAWLLPMEWED